MDEIIRIDRNIIVNYRYLLGIAILATLYTGAQAFRHATGKEMFHRRTSALADFIGDQVCLIMYFDFWLHLNKYVDQKKINS